MRAGLATACALCLLVVVGLAGTEAALRLGLHLTNFPNPHYYALDRVKIWNRKFYETHPDYFRNWPIPLRFFDAGAPWPQYLFKPNARLAAPGKPGKIEWSSNSWGFRGPEFSVRKPPGVIRIVCLGASTTQGTWADDQTYPYYLQEELSRMFPRQRIEVINAGHDKYTEDDIRLLLDMRVLPLDPDVIVLYEAANSIDWPEFVGGIRCTLGNCWKTSYPAWFWVLYTHSRLIGRLAYHLGWFSRPVGVGQVPPPMPHRFVDSLSNPSAVHFKTALSQIVQDAREHEIVIVLASFVTVARPGLDVSYKENPGLFDALHRRYYPLSPGEVGKVYTDFNAETAAVAREYGVPYADIAAEFPKRVRYFPFDEIHLSPDGYHLLAADLAQFLAAKVLPPLILKHPAALR